MPQRLPSLRLRERDPNSWEARSEAFSLAILKCRLPMELFRDISMELCQGLQWHHNEICLQFRRWQMIVLLLLDLWLMSPDRNPVFQLALVSVSLPQRDWQSEQMSETPLLIFLSVQRMQKSRREFHLGLFFHPPKLSGRRSWRFS